MLQKLDNQALVKLAPSILAGSGALGVSKNYAFLPTIEVVDMLRGAGWFPVKANQCNVRSVDRQGFQKHMVRFRRDEQSLNSKVGDVIPELVLLNSHDRSTSYQLHAGMFRLVCSNGMVVSDGVFQKISIKHVGFDKNDVIEASFKILDNIPRITNQVAEMKQIFLSQEERMIYAASALTLKYGEEEAPIEPRQLLHCRRPEDDQHNLWTVMNRIQENLIRGKLEGRARTKKDPSKFRHTSTRPVKSISEDIRLNKALWDLTEKMRELKSA